MLSLIGGILGSTGFGGVIGLVGTAFQSFMHQREEKTQLEHDLAMRREDRKDMQKEAELGIQRVNVEMAGQLQLAEQNMLAEQQKAEADIASKELEIEADAIVASYQNDKAAYSDGKLSWVDMLRGSIRPMITLWGVIVLTGLAVVLTIHLGGLTELISKDSAKAWLILGQIIDAIIFIATTSATWWFGSRRMAKKRDE